MTERTLRVPVRRCGNWAPSWYEGLGGCSCLTAVCRTADDGFHQHELRAGDEACSRVVVTEHRHTWMDGAFVVSVERGREHRNVDGNFAQVWRSVAEDEGRDTALPAMPCQETTVSELTVVAGPYRPPSTVRYCDVGGEAFGWDADWWLVAAPDRGWETGHGVSCGQHLPIPVAPPARSNKRRVRDLLVMPRPLGVSIPGRNTELLLPDGESTMRLLAWEDQRWRMWNGSTIVLQGCVTGPATRYSGREFFERIPGCRSGGVTGPNGRMDLGFGQDTEMTVIRAMPHSCGLAPGQRCEPPWEAPCSSPVADAVDLAETPTDG